MASKQDSAQATSVDDSAGLSGDGGDPSDEFEESLQAGLNKVLTQLRLKSDDAEGNIIVDGLRSYPFVALGVASAVGWVAGFAIRRFNPIRGRK